MHVTHTRSNVSIIFLSKTFQCDRKQENPQERGSAIEINSQRVDRSDRLNDRRITHVRSAMISGDGTATYLQQKRSRLDQTNQMNKTEKTINIREIGKISREASGNGSIF